MKRFKKWRDSLTWKQAMAITVIIAFFIYLMFRWGIYFFGAKDIGTDMELLILAIMFFLPIAPIGTLLLCSEKGEKEKQKEKGRKVKKKIDIRKDEYKEIFRKPDGYHPESVSAEMDFTIVRDNVKPRYFIKLISEDEYNLIAINENGEKVYDKNLNNWRYLENIFDV